MKLRNQVCVCVCKFEILLVESPLCSILFFLLSSPFIIISHLLRAQRVRHKNKKRVSVSVRVCVCELAKQMKSREIEREKKRKIMILYRNYNNYHGNLKFQLFRLERVRSYCPVSSLLSSLFSLIAKKVVMIAGLVLLFAIIIIHGLFLLGLLSNMMIKTGPSTQSPK